jgi:hypothetical protein
MPIAFKHIGHLQAGKSRPQLDRGRLSVNCSDWPVANCVLLPERREHYAVRLLNRNPN